MAATGHAYFVPKIQNYLDIKGRGVTLIFVKLDIEIAVDQQNRARDRTFEEVSDSGCPRPRSPKITLTCSKSCFGVLYLLLLVSWTHI